ncbi:MAG: hypothetical protein HZB39_12720 [Planctomycetes bacterium]|nr:hypothetical protein [Planctomycetota bacterium]
MTSLKAVNFGDAALEPVRRRLAHPDRQVEVVVEVAVDQVVRRREHEVAVHRGVVLQATVLGRVVRRARIQQRVDVLEVPLLAADRATAGEGREVVVVLLDALEDQEEVLGSLAEEGAFAQVVLVACLAVLVVLGERLVGDAEPGLHLRVVLFEPLREEVHAKPAIEGARLRDDAIEAATDELLEFGADLRLDLRFERDDPRLERRPDAEVPGLDPEDLRVIEVLVDVGGRDGLRPALAELEGPVADVVELLDQLRIVPGVGIDPPLGELGRGLRAERHAERGCERECEREERDGAAERHFSRSFHFLDSSIAVNDAIVSIGGALSTTARSALIASRFTEASPASR